MIVVGVALCVASAGVALAATSITAPSTRPFSVPGDASGNPLAFTVVATGYAPGQQVFVEQCDNVPPTDRFWDPTVNCDLASSNAPVQADATGKATFVATDLNHRFLPFKGASPQMSFNCLSPNQADPGNGLPSFRNCQIRVSSNNGSSTSDQAFLTIVLPDTPVGTTTSTVATTTTIPVTTTTAPVTTTTAPVTTTTAPATTTTVATTTTTTVPVTTTTNPGTTTTIPVTTTTHPATTTTTIPVTTTTHATTTTSTTTTIPVTTTTDPATTTTDPVTTTTDPVTTTTLQALNVTTTTAPTVNLSGTGTGTLPRTGSSPAPLLLTGLGLVVAGLGLVIGGTYVTRKPRYNAGAYYRS